MLKPSKWMNGCAAGMLALASIAPQAHADECGKDAAVGGLIGAAAGLILSRGKVGGAVIGGAGGAAVGCIIGSEEEARRKALESERMNERIRYRENNQDYTVVVTRVYYPRPAEPTFTCKTVQRQNLNTGVETTREYCRYDNGWGESRETVTTTTTVTSPAPMEPMAPMPPAPPMPPMPPQAPEQSVTTTTVTTTYGSPYPDSQIIEYENAESDVVISSGQPYHWHRRDGSWGYTELIPGSQFVNYRGEVCWNFRGHRFIPGYGERDFTEIRCRNAYDGRWYRFERPVERVFECRIQDRNGFWVGATSVDPYAARRSAIDQCARSFYDYYRGQAHCAREADLRCPH